MPLSIPRTPSIGTDIVKISRLAKYADPESARPFARRIFTPRELQAYEAATLTPEHRTRFLASRFAAKEAVIKTVRRRRVYYRHVEIYKRADGSPYAVVLDDDAASVPVAPVTTTTTMTAEQQPPSLVAEPEALGGHVHGVLVGLSIAHEDEYAVAVAVGDYGDAGPVG